MVNQFEHNDPQWVAGKTFLVSVSFTQLPDPVPSEYPALRRMCLSCRTNVTDSCH